MKKRILPILLALLMVLSLIPASFAETGAQGEAELCDHEHEELALVEETEAIESIESVEEPEVVEPVEIPEEIEEAEEPAVVEPVEIPEEAEVIETVGLSDETDNDPDTCTHENTFETVEEKDVTYTDTGDNWGHEESGIRVFRTVCEDCGSVLSEQEQPFTEEASHVYDENGVCEFCNHVNSCAHENTVEFEYWDYDNCTITDLGDKHEVSGPYQWVIFCEDCFQEISVRTENRTGQEPHDYGDDGICQFCGHENTCTHEHYIEDWYWDPYHLNTFTDTGDNKTHEASGVRTWYKYCQDCGQHFEHWNKEYSGPDYHSYTDEGVCYNCGHVNTCTHEHTYEKRYWKDETQNTYTDTGDNAKHEVSGMTQVYTYCSDCEQYLIEAYREEPYSVMKDHNYDANGKCKDCGHVMTYTITANAAPAAGGTVTGAGTYDTGATVKLTAKAKSGYAFVNWTENGKEVSKSATYSFKAAADRKMTANFKKTTPPAFSGTVELNKADVEYKGTTPYRVYNGKAQTPRVIVKDKSGKTVAASKYTVTYRNNTKPGTAYADVVMKDTGAKKSVWFKIYLPATETTTVKNVGNEFTKEEDPNDVKGIQISWKKVPGAKGYVIYRRAWNLQSKGWTTFERWNNTTKTTWVDTKVYPGTRYQYGIKAYFSDPMDNYNLGLVGPLKTTVRITTRRGSWWGGDGHGGHFISWEPSSLFTGYQVQIVTSKEEMGEEVDTKNAKVVTIKDPKVVRYSVPIVPETYYYMRVRSYHVFEGTTYYGAWNFWARAFYTNKPLD